MSLGSGLWSRYFFGVVTGHWAAVVVSWEASSLAILGCSRRFFGVVIYEEPQRPLKQVIRELQALDDWVVRYKADSGEAAGRRRNAHADWSLGEDGLLRYKDLLYVLNNRLLGKSLSANTIIIL